MAHRPLIPPAQPLLHQPGAPAPGLQPYGHPVNPPVAAAMGILNFLNTPFSLLLIPPLISLPQSISAVDFGSQLSKITRFLNPGAHHGEVEEKPAPVVEQEEERSVLVERYVVPVRRLADIIGGRSNGEGEGEGEDPTHALVSDGKQGVWFLWLSDGDDNAASVTAVVSSATTAANTETAPAPPPEDELPLHDEDEKPAVDEDAAATAATTAAAPPPPPPPPAPVEPEFEPLDKVYNDTAVAISRQLDRSSPLHHNRLGADMIDSLFAAVPKTLDNGVPVRFGFVDCRGDEEGHRLCRRMLKVPGKGPQLYVVVPHEQPPVVKTSTSTSTEVEADTSTTASAVAEEETAAPAESVAPAAAPASGDEGPVEGPVVVEQVDKVVDQEIPTEQTIPQGPRWVLHKVPLKANLTSTDLLHFYERRGWEKLPGWTGPLNPIDGQISTAYDGQVGEVLGHAHELWYALPMWAVGMVVGLGLNSLTMRVINGRTVKKEKKKVAKREKRAAEAEEKARKEHERKEVEEKVRREREEHERAMKEKEAREKREAEEAARKKKEEEEAAAAAEEDEEEEDEEEEEEEEEDEDDEEAKKAPAVPPTTTPVVLKKEGLDDDEEEDGEEEEDEDDTGSEGEREKRDRMAMSGTTVVEEVEMQEMRDVREEKVVRPSEH